ncbi:3-deoxy-manno-octulosonate cytidylyltransferase [Sinorhizobium prairiense]|uniref:3-deoxy-manno-octulosonate cytidylyltransferase n=1 Tax=unclassified Sinorhizobium TaxID=2613772 RepID=UPI0023D8AA77|nr:MULTISPECIES: 3-deoxy-manno-octulosonate cytidylyltransferase [unclassified Sinorhizobium]WEJ13723.1 3-deoxy-manno-octulosonate cytidylyltransferase [Sinorhizobium sp. M103]WEJ17992.1 3-deoxy-manno-octulosonate cytidylyltransferase [Sinorhizobium sp. K101]WEJ38722.1 3-deoxy-manno-octulosonate cytidylyltransferase [Sinorhizobium sp. C101]
MDFPASGATENLATPEQWRALFSRFSHVVLVANSDEVSVKELQEEYPGTALFVFFNKVYKILDKQFSGNSLLISRAQPRGANIVYRNEVADVVKLLASQKFLGIMNIRLAEIERLNTSADYLDTPTGHLDLVGFCADFYPKDKVATSGFAMALWLVNQSLPAEIVLAGFSAKRSDKWRVVNVHDWTFEQVFLRLFARVGKLTMHGSRPANSYMTLASRFPELPAAEISATIAEVLSLRLSQTDAQVDKLISLTGAFRSIDELLRRLKPKFLKKTKA